MPRRGGKPADISDSLLQFERLEPLLARQMSATDDERVLSVLQDLLPADTAAALHEHARELMQRRARAASAPVDAALRARVAALESQAVELADAIQKQRGDAPEWASQRLDEEQRRALSARPRRERHEVRRRLAAVAGDHARRERVGRVGRGARRRGRRERDDTAPLWLLRHL